MFSSARIGCPAATWPTSGRPPLLVTTLLAAPTALSSSSIARGFVGSRRSMPTFSRLARWACTVDDEARPTALPMSRTVGGYPYFAEYRLMNSKISCWRLVRSRSTIATVLLASLWRPNEHVFGTIAPAADAAQVAAERLRDPLAGCSEPRLSGAILGRPRAPVAELVDAQG